MAAPVIHFEMGVSNTGKSTEFYSKLFDWKFQEHGDSDYHLVGPAGDGSIGGGLGPSREGVPPYLTIYIQVDDLQSYLDKAESLGGKTVVPPTDIPGVGSMAWLADPDGITVGLFKGAE